MEQFKIYIKFVSNTPGMCMHIEDHDETTLTSALERLLRGPGMIIGIYEEIKVVDQSDCTNLLWNNVDGLVFPTQEHMQEVSHG